MQAKSFIDILAHELRKEIRAEVEAELASRKSPSAPVERAHKAESVELWLNLKMGGAFVGNAGAGKASAYSKSARSSQPSAKAIMPSAKEEKAERVGKVSTIEQTFAFEFFVREGSKLKSTFSESELKSEFRKIALRIHPDRHSNASAEQIKSFSARFQTLVESAEILEAALQN